MYEVLITIWCNLSANENGKSARWSAVYSIRFDLFTIIIGVSLWSHEFIVGMNANTGTTNSGLFWLNGGGAFAPYSFVASSAHHHNLLNLLFPCLSILQPIICNFYKIKDKPFWGASPPVFGVLCAATGQRLCFVGLTCQCRCQAISMKIKLLKRI